MSPLQKGHSHENEKLKTLFREINYAEKSGSGFDKIFRSLLIKGKQLPVFEITDHSVKMKIFSATLEEGLIELTYYYRQLKGDDIDLDKVLVLNSIIKKKKLRFNDLAKLPYINENLLKKFSMNYLLMLRKPWNNGVLE